MALNNPANLAEGMPAVMQKAAEVKIAEDMKPQKIKAIKYLTGIGCGCYDLDGSITQALVEAMGDCTEEVRLATVEAIAEAAQGSCCANCGETCCCKEPVVKKLASMAYERDDHGCYIEPSARVRQAAALALIICCPDMGPVPIEEVEPPQPQPMPEGNGPEGTAPETEEFDNGEPEELLESPATAAIPAPVMAPAPVVGRLRYTGPADAVAPNPPQLSEAAARPTRPPLPDQVLCGPGPGQLALSHLPRPAAKPAPSAKPAQSSPAARGRMDEGYGVIVSLQAKQGLAHVHFAQRDKQVPTGTRLTVIRRKGSRHHVVGQVEIQQSFPGASNVRATGSTKLGQLRSGDIVTIPVLTAGHRPTSI
jgi:hypothetical protein